MRNELYDHHHHHHSINDSQKRIYMNYMPMFCRLSVKDVKLNTHYRDPMAAAGEPSSPKVTCIGQVKRNNRVIGFPAAAAVTSSVAVATANHQHKPIKLNKLFSSKTLLPNATAAMNPTTTAKTGGGRRSGSRSCRSGREMRVINSRRPRVRSTADCDQEYCVVKEVVDIGEMDPPLPVVKRVATPPEVNIWKRRFNDRVGLQIEPIHLPNNIKFEPPPTTV